MQMRYVFSELGTGLRRNVTMTIAVIVTSGHLARPGRRWAC